MPKSTKAAPPQQASLQELWGKKKVVKTKMECIAEPKIELEAMDIDLQQEQTGMLNTIRMQCFLFISCIGETAKRREPTPPSCTFLPYINGLS